MADLLKLYASYLLERVQDDVEHRDTSADDDNRPSSSDSVPTRGKRRDAAAAVSPDGHDARLDYDGPRLIDGCTWWIRYYQATGHICSLKWPLIVTIIYRVLLVSGSLVALKPRVNSLFHISSIEISLETTLFAATFALSAVLGQLIIWRTFYVSLFDSAALLDILFTPKLCYLKPEVLKKIGNKTLLLAIAFAYYHVLMVVLITYNSWYEFKEDASVRFICLEIPLIVLLSSYVFIGPTHLDFYIRTSFAFWLLSLRRTLKLKSIKKMKKTLSDSNRQQSELLDDSQSQESIADTNNENNETYTTQFRQVDCKLVTFDDILKSLNEMDNHLEAHRNNQAFGIITLTLNSYLGTGCTLLLAYTVFAIQDNYFHGFILCMMTINLSIYTFFIYFGDSFISYALSSLVSSVEDEFYMQPSDPSNEICSSSTSKIEAKRVWRECNCNSCLFDFRRTGSSGRCFRVTSNDVMFFREFLHQFKGHLATPWSQMNVHAHFKMFLAFVTLTAIQIMLEHEHK